jgi:opacity protein-like surface antigen
MKKRNLSSLMCAAVFFGSTSLAMAGAYGEPEQPMELPPPAPAPAPVSYAEPMDADYAALGPYLAVGGIYSFEIFSGAADSLNPAYGWGLSARGGYRLHPNFSAELLFENFFGWDTDPVGDVNAWLLMANGKGFLMTGPCQPYISLGLGIFDADTPAGVDDGLGFAIRPGIGMDLYFTENLYLEVEGEYVKPFGDPEDLSSLGIGVGLGYKFN